MGSKTREWEVNSATDLKYYVLVISGRHIKVLQNGWFTQQEFIFSQFWSLEI
jgi:hypothetical protein